MHLEDVHHGKTLIAVLGDSATEPYIVSHYQLLAHAAAVNIYKTKYQTIFDNILNRKIPWPAVPEEMSPEAQDLIDRLFTEDPNQRLGARGASEVKEHVFFKDINWDTLARQKAAFVPASESALDTSYFTSRYSWNTSDGLVYHASDAEDSSDADSLSGSSSCLSNRQDEVGDECGGLAEFDSSSSVNYSFSNFSFKQRAMFVDEIWHATEYCEKYAKAEDVGAAPEEKSSDDEEISEDQYDSSDEQVAGKADP